MGHRTSEHLSSPLIRSSLQSCNSAFALVNQCLIRAHRLLDGNGGLVNRTRVKPSLRVLVEPFLKQKQPNKRYMVADREVLGGSSQVGHRQLELNHLARFDRIYRRRQRIGNSGGWLRGRLHRHLWCRRRLFFNGRSRDYQWTGSHGCGRRGLRRWRLGRSVSVLTLFF
jgi:hypothetical protein